jgi:pimeloyl-ACP methyl ester carboxylesterase
VPIFDYDDQTAIYYESYGSGGPPAVLLHGFGDSGETWNRIIPFLEGGRRLYVLDLRGCGRSSKPPDNRYSIADHAAIVSAFLLDRRLEKASVVGHSMGGAIALRLALDLQAERPGAIARLVLLDSAGLPQRVPSFVWMPALPVLGPVLLYATPARLQSLLSIRPLYRVRGVYGPERSRRYARALRSRGGVMALVRTARLMIAEEGASWLSRISSLGNTTKIVWGEQDPAIPLENAYLFRGMIPESDLTVIASCGHVCQEEFPDVVGPLLDKFLSA